MLEFDDETLVFSGGLRLAQTMRLTIAAYSGPKNASFLPWFAPRPNSAQKVAAYPGLKNDMQTQGPKTIGHMNT
jgi:hypothetical protein